MKKYLPVAAAFAILAVGAFSTAAYANPSLFLRKQSASATSTPVFMTAGTATTTLTFDIGANISKAADSIVLLEQFSGSSTNSVLNTDVQYSQDGIDWYATSLAWTTDVTGNSATTSPALGNVEKYSFAFASSTINEAAADSNFAKSDRVVMLPTPTRFIRAVFTLPTTSTNGAVWAEFVAKQQAP